MISSSKRRLGGFILAVALLTGPARAQALTLSSEMGAGAVSGLNVRRLGEPNTDVGFIGIFVTQKPQINLTRLPRAESVVVLVVDDEPPVCEFLRRWLEAWGYAVRQAGNATEALEVMLADPASIMLCDIRMPGHDGLWLAERVHEKWPQTAIIMATALDDLPTVLKSRQLGAVDCRERHAASDVLALITALIGGMTMPGEPRTAPRDVPRIADRSTTLKPGVCRSRIAGFVT
jgi:CheY-like chemotaxis protein